MRAVQCQEFGEFDVLRVEEVPVPHAGPGQVRVAVRACGLNPADWGVCGGFFGGDLPQGIGLEVSGIVDEVGDGVRTASVGDAVLGPVARGAATAGAAEFAVLSTWARVPEGVDLLQAAAMPMAAETAYRGLDELGVRSGETLLVHGAGSVIGWAAVQLALHRGARVIATAGPARADLLRELGAEVTGYGDGMPERVSTLAGGRIDRALDIGPAHLGVDGVLPALVELTGDPARVVTLTDFDGAETLGVRASGPSGTVFRYDVLDEVVRLAAQGSFTVPIGRTFPLEGVHDAARLSWTGRPGGKLLLLPRQRIT